MIFAMIRDMEMMVKTIADAHEGKLYGHKLEIAAMEAKDTLEEWKEKTKGMRL